MVGLGPPLRDMTLSNPHAFWLLGIVPLVWLLAWLSRGLHAPRRLSLATGARTLALLLLVVALAQPTALQRLDVKSVVYAIDVSHSVSSAFLKQALDWATAANQRYQPEQTRYLVFADGVRLLESPEQVLSVTVSSKPAEQGRFGKASGNGPQRDRGVIGQSATDIESALHAAMFGFAPGHARRLVLITDGNQTRGDIERAMTRLQNERVRVFAIPAAASADSDAWIESIEFPPGVRQQEPAVVRVVVRSLNAMPALVELKNGGRVLGKREVRLSAGESSVTFDTRLPKAGTSVLTAQLTAKADRVAENNVLSASVRVGPRPRVLYVEGTPESAHYLADALRVHHIDVTVSTAKGLDDNPERLNGYDAVIISDVYAHDFGPETVRRLGMFVHERGGGLVFAAGESTYGKQGYAGNDIERLLPVRFEAKRKRRELDLVLLIDRSHSMRGRKLELAKTAALSTLDLLEEQHRLAVIGFDARPHAVVPLREVGNKRRAEDLISSMTASGQTRIYPALAMAQRVLADSTSSTRHIILLSDGVTAAGSAGANAAQRIQEEIQRGRDEAIRRAAGPNGSAATPELTSQAGSMEELVAQLAADEISLSTIAIGPKPNVDMMSAIAEAAGGKAYVASNDAEMPGLFVSETRRLLGDSIVEEPFRPVAGYRAGPIDGLDFESGPPLGGFVTTRAKQFSDVMLRAPEDQPLLVATHYGLGRTVAFLSDVKNRWSSQWLQWDGYGRFWSQVVRDVIARRTEVGFDWRVTRTGGDAMVEMTAMSADYRFRNGLYPRVRVTAPSGETATLLLRQVAPGAYRARLPISAGAASPYRFALVEGGGIARADIAQAGEQLLSYTWTDEYRSLPPNNALLRELSESTGGVFAPKAQDVFADYGDSELVPQPLWHWFVAAALLLFLADILIRRSPWFVR